MRILVTGGAGYIGSHAVRLFLARGHDVWVYDNLSLGHRAAVPAERLIVGDLAEAAAARPCAGAAPHRGGRPLRRLRLRRRIGARPRPSTTRTTSSTRCTLMECHAPPSRRPLCLLQHLRHLRHAGAQCRSPRTRRSSRSIPTATASWPSSGPGRLRRRLRMGLRRPALLQRRRRQPRRQPSARTTIRKRT